jgi:hypothetical protein
VYRVLQEGDPHRQGEQGDEEEVESRHHGAVVSATYIF